MKKEFVPYLLALRLKALGFNEPCFSFYMGGFKELGKIKYVNPSNVTETNVLAPTFSQAFRWFRENYSIVCILKFNEDIKNEWCGCIYGHFEIHGQFSFGNTELFKTYEEAELASLEKLLEVVSEFNHQKHE